MKTKQFWGYPWLCLCLFLSLLASCKVLSPVNALTEGGQQRWTIEAKVVPGYGAESLTNGMDWTVQPPIYVMDNTIVLPDKRVIAVVYYAKSYQMAQRIREGLLATGVVQNVKITN